ncbi:hypothetical protein LKL54_15980 [Listeria monocytogenes ATCC 19115]|nr:hypothetical protein [Listeria monocytogenes]MCY7430083.1 hypothetical protein [Listeria monocytogenes ATCC 19115]
MCIRDSLNSVIKELFLILDVPEKQRYDMPDWLKDFHTLMATFSKNHIMI